MNMFNQLLKTESPEQKFWKWFSAKSAQFFDFEQNQDRLFDELSKALSKVNEALCFEFGPKRDDGKREFIVSAGGVVEVFSAVLKLTDQAPALQQWEIVAFRPRRPADFIDGMALDIDGYVLEAEQVGFVIEPDGQRVGLNVFVKEHDVAKESVIFATYLMLDTVLGEYDVETKLGFIEHCNWLESQNTNVRPLTQLAEAVDTLFRQLNEK